MVTHNNQKTQSVCCTQIFMVSMPHKNILQTNVSQSTRFCHLKFFWIIFRGFIDPRQVFDGKIFQATYSTFILAYTHYSIVSFMNCISVHKVICLHTLIWGGHWSGWTCQCCSARLHKCRQLSASTAPSLSQWFADGQFQACTSGSTLWVQAVCAKMHTKRDDPQ